MQLSTSGETKNSILKNYPYLQLEDIEDVLLYAAFLAEEETLEFIK